MSVRLDGIDGRDFTHVGFRYPFRRPTAGTKRPRDPHRRRRWPEHPACALLIPLASPSASGRRMRRNRNQAAGGLLQPGSLANHPAPLCPGSFPQFGFKRHQLFVQRIAVLLIVAPGYDGCDAAAIEIECHPQRQLTRGAHCRTGCAERANGIRIEWLWISSFPRRQR
jgi:hypothetical protein